MNNVKKMKVLGEHYKITGWDKLDLKEKLQALKDRLGVSTLDAAWSKYEQEKAGKKVEPVAGKPDVGNAASVGSGVLSGATAKANTPAPSASTTTVSPGAPNGATMQRVDVAAPSLQVHVAPPAVTVSQSNITLSHFATRAWTWAQAFALGALASTVYWQSVKIGGSVARAFVP